MPEILRKLIAQKKWKLNAIDTKTAFLQGDKIDRENYLVPLKEANATNACQLKKCIYGVGMPHVNGTI